MISEAVVEEVKYRNDIEDVISSYVALKRAGSNMSGLCPFHSERTPSFTVFGASHSFYCFGCGAGGDVITFIMKIENLDYVSALEFLCNRAGIPFSNDDSKDGNEPAVKKTRIIEMNREAARFFFNELTKSKPALDYLSGRKLPMPLIRHFGLGYSPDGFGNLYNHMHSKGYTDDELTAGFLCGISQKTHRPYDMFRNRVMFPIVDVSGNVIAFGGRVMDNSMPKYLNSSDTPAFKKSRNLFALNFARNSCSERMILCEGYMDVIALHGAGFTNAVATLGTAMTQEHARIMKRYTKQVIISYDSDTAGQNAADKAFRFLSEAGVEARILRMEGAKDPDEYIKKFGSERFKLLLDKSYSQFDFKFNNILAKYDISINSEKVKAAKDAVALISDIYSTVEREIYIIQVSDKLSIPAESLKNDVERNIRKNKSKDKNSEFVNVVHQTQGIGDRINPDYMKNTKAARAEEAILGMLLIRYEYINDEPITSDDFFTEFNRRVFEAVVQCNGNFSLLGSCFSPDEMGRITKMKVARELLTNNREIFSDYVKALKKAKPITFEDIQNIRKV